MMQAGLTDRVCDMAELVDLIEEVNAPQPAQSN
jgi:hypothetical protein